MAKPPQKLAVDSNILFAIAAGQKATAALLATARSGSIQLFVPRTCLSELHFAFSKGDVEAGRSIKTIASHAISPLLLNSTQQAIASSVARRLLEEGILPVLEKRDAMALAETAAAGLSALVTFDRHFLDIDRRKLGALLLAEHVAQVAILSPIEITKAANRAAS